ncbi:MAG: hypothetical protein JNK51_01325 [Blastocatellia bacterium]|nr:hypothetical protein [Chloracidobacterium sp.]MBL8183537.1 hypothetical protein [Blastocatellia bacterium]HRJ88185.1 hypothetical protein [Pyrinomonadaceae bacterium]HRK49251.1 hypothetical protein [Pyrinomonadaceae bacterium]
MRTETTHTRLKILFALMLCIGASYSGTRANVAPADPVLPDRMKGIQYGFDPKTVPNFDKQALFVVFYGFGKKGWDDATGKRYPIEPRRIFSRIYRLGDLPYGYNWNSQSLAPNQMAKIFFDYLINSYDFKRGQHEVMYLRSQYLDKIESDIAEMLRGMPKEEIVIPDTKFSFSYQDKNYVRPYSFEYIAPQ